LAEHSQNEQVFQLKTNDNEESKKLNYTGCKLYSKIWAKKGKVPEGYVEEVKVRNVEVDRGSTETINEEHDSQTLASQDDIKRYKKIYYKYLKMYPNVKGKAERLAKQNVSLVKSLKRDLYKVVDQVKKEFGFGDSHPTITEFVSQIEMQCVKFEHQLHNDLVERAQGIVPRDLHAAIADAGKIYRGNFSPQYVEEYEAIAVKLRNNEDLIVQANDRWDEEVEDYKQFRDNFASQSRENFKIFAQQLKEMGDMYREGMRGREMQKINIWE